MKKSVIVLSLALIFTAITVLAQADVSQEISLDEQVQAQDLGVSEPNILPDSPFYFLKNWSRGIQSVLTFDSVKKAELKLKFANEKLIEAKKLAEEKKNSEIIKKGVQNYQEELNKIKEATDKIKEKAKDNEEVNKFLDKFTQQQLLHQKLLEKLETQVPEEVFEKIKEAREQHLERFSEVMTKLEDRKEKIQERLEKTLEEVKGSQFKNFKNLEVLKNLEEKVPEEAKEAIQRAEENALKRLQGDLEKMSPEDQEKFKEYIEKISGEKEKQLEILENLKAKIKETPETPKLHELKEKLEEIAPKIFEVIKERAAQRNCPEVLIPTIACEEMKGRWVAGTNPETGCPLPAKCVLPGEEMTEKLVTCCVDDVCLKQNKKNCEWAGGRVVDTKSCYPNPCVGKKTEIPEKEEAVIQPGACITLWDPVCGKDAKTYSNKCFAKSAGVEIDYNGICKEKEIEKPATQSPAPVETTPER